jgi:hypothetical protein
MSEEWLGTDVPLHAQHDRPAGMGLHICAVVQRGSRSPREHVEVVSDGAEPVPVPVTGLELTDCCGQHHEHVWLFAQGELAAGQTAHDYRGHGQRTRTGDLILYAGLPAPVWKDKSPVAYLRHPTAGSSTQRTPGARKTRRTCGRV